MSADTTTEADVIYPDSDGQPMADNTLQYQWIVTIMGNLDDLFATNPDVFVAGDNLIYPVKGNNKVRQAPDVYVAFGRPKGHRGSYKVWAEGGVFPQVVFEVTSPGNRAGEMRRKLQFYQRHGAQEYYVHDPDRNRTTGYARAADGTLAPVPEMNGFTSPLLGVRFDTSGDPLVIYRPDGRPFLTFQQLADRGRAAEQHAAAAEQRAEQARRAAEAERTRADAVQQELARALAMLRAAGLDPDAPAPG
jgi:Uma2 family endonuclease